tara:strand:+ start:193 stop:303 length:111 start_codon:yes stop_codon:yes gene_type:complete
MLMWNKYNTRLTEAQNTRHLPREIKLINNGSERNGY